MTHSDFFFVYNKDLFTYLHDTKKLNYITIAKNPTSGKTFSMFLKSDQLQSAIDEYKECKKNDICKNLR